MNETVNENLEQALFERAAEKCDSDKARITFCEQYLKKKGIETIPPGTTPNFGFQDYQKYTRDYEKSGKAETYTFTARESIIDYDSLRMAPNGSAFLRSIKVNLVNKLMNELIDKDMIRFEEARNYAMDSMEFYAGIKVAKWSK